jgi:hypothetical protein
MLLASSFDEPNYFKAADFATEKKFRIKNVAPEDVGKNKERKLVVRFTNDKRGLILNRTNNRTLRGAFGDDCDGWAGKIVILFPTSTEVGGEMKPAIRVRIPPPKAGGNGQVAKPSPAPTPPPVAEIDPAEIDPDVDPDLNDEIVI